MADGEPAVAGPPQGGAPLSYQNFLKAGAAPDTTAAPPPGAPLSYADFLKAGSGGTPPSSALDAGIVHAGDAMTFGLLPKAVAGVMHVTTGKPYADLLNMAHTAMSQEKAAHPVASGVGTVGGAVLNPANLLIPGVGEGATVGDLAAGGAKAGGLLGAADAAGHSSGSLMDRAQQTGEGALGGAAGGGLLGAAGGAIAPALSAKARVAQAAAASGFENLKAALAGLTGAGRGEVASLADLSPQLAKLADQSATRSAVANKTLSDMTAARQATQGDRVLGDFRDALSGRSPNAPALSDELDQARREWAASPAGFGGLRDQNPDVDISGLQASLQHPMIQDALKKARLAGELKPDDQVTQLLAKIQASNPGAVVPPSVLKSLLPSGGASQGVSYGDLQALSQELDARATKAFNTRGGGNLGAALVPIRDAVEGTLAKVSGHSDIMAGYADRSEGIKALAQGEDAWTRQDARQIGPEMAALSPQNADLYREGLASKAIAELNAKGSNRDVAKEMVAMSPATKAKIVAAFGDQQTAAAFMQRQQAERQLSLMKGATTGSQTAGRLANATSLYGLGAAGTGVATAMAGHPAIGATMAGSAIAKYAADRLEQRVAGKTGSLLATQGSDAITKLLAALRQQGALGTGLQGAAAGASGLAGSQIPGLMNR